MSWVPTGTVRARPGIFTLMRARSPRFLPEKCLWATCAIFARRRRVLWLHFTLVWVAVRVTLAAPEYSGSLPEYSGPAPTVLWVATRVLGRTHTGTEPGNDPQVAFATRKLHVRHVRTIYVSSETTLAGFDVSLALLWVAPWLPFI